MSHSNKPTPGLTHAREEQHPEYISIAEHSSKIVAESRGEHFTIVRFLVVGIWNTIFGYLVYYIALHVIAAFFESAKQPYLWAIGVAQVIGTINAYISHRKVTFAERAGGRKAKEFIRFSLIYVLTFCLSLILLPVLVEMFVVKAEMAGIIVICISTAVSYFGHSRFSFNHNDGRSDVSR